MLKRVTCKAAVKKKKKGREGENRELMFIKCWLYNRNYALYFSYITSFKFQNISESGIKRKVIREKHGG